ncbi:MAG: lysine--tRNA ligase, partial [Candidatus Methanoplasma sp.]|nr:lysine--tRNA ligase [Candidatus Methanoplasma sp.]
DTVGQIISETGKDSTIGLKAGFKAIYQVLIGKEAGPRLGPFLASMDKQFVINRFIQAYRQTS